MSKVPALHRFAPDGGGSRAVEFEVGDLRVMVKHWDRDNNERVWELAKELSTALPRLERASAELDELRTKIAKSRPAQLLGTGYVRFCGEELWILNRRERGFGEFGFQCADWDELFRRFNCRVTGHGTDEHGPWWSVEPMAVQS